MGCGTEDARPASTGISVRHSANVQLKDIAVAFQTLQVAREEADYNHAYSLTRAATWNLIDTAVDAIGKVDALSTAKSNVLQMFLFLLAIAPKG